MTRRHPRALPHRLEGSPPIDGRHAEHLVARRRQVTADDHRNTARRAGGPQAGQWRPDAAAAVSEAIPAAAVRRLLRP